MPARSPSSLRTGLLGLGACLIGALSGCASDQRFDQSRVAQRPTYPIEGTRPLYLGGYAGADYHPTSRPSR